MPNRPVGTKQGTFLTEREHNIPQQWKKQPQVHRRRGGRLFNPGAAAILHGGARCQSEAVPERRRTRRRRLVPAERHGRKIPFRRDSWARNGYRKILFRRGEGGGQRRRFVTVRDSRLGNLSIDVPQKAANKRVFFSFPS